MTKKKNENPTHYVDDKAFYTAMIQYKTAVKHAKENNLQKPRVPEFVGECIQKIAYNLSNNQNFINYPFKEDMIGDGIENSLKYIDNFNTEKYTKPFNYFTTIIWYAFINRIKREKRQLVIKQKSLEDALLFGQLETHQFGDGTSRVFSTVDLSNDYMVNLVADFDAKIAEKKKKKPRKSALTKFYEEDNEEGT